MPRRVPQTDFTAALHVLTKADIDFIVIGALAGIAHGLGRATYDVDVVYSRTPENMRKIVQALAPLRPYLRGAPPGLPSSFDERAIRDGLNFTLLTSIGGMTCWEKLRVVAPTKIFVHLPIASALSDPNFSLSASTS